MIWVICLIAIHIEGIGTLRIGRRVFHMQVNLLRPEVILGFRGDPVKMYAVDPESFSFRNQHGVMKIGADIKKVPLSLPYRFYRHIKNGLLR